MSVFDRIGKTVFRDLDGILFFGLRINGDTDLFTDDLKLLDRGGTVNVAGNENGVFALLFHHCGKLTCVCGLTGTLKTDHHDDCRGLGIDLQFRLRTAHERGQFLVNDLDDLLCGHQAFENLRANGAFGDLTDKFANDLEVYVCFEERELNGTHTFFDVFFGQIAFVFEFLKGIREFVLQIFKHKKTSFCKVLRGYREMDPKSSAT